MDNRLDPLLEQTLPLRGVCVFSRVKDRLLDNSAARRLPANPASIIAAVFPYSLQDSSYDRADISRFASVTDYHKVVLTRLEAAAAGLKELFPNEEFACFCDNSPIPEPFAAAAAGLGFVGKNNLLIHPLFGSWVFIGEIVTSLLLKPSDAPEGGCGACRLCEKACPAGILGKQLFDKTRCLSHITQRKGALTLQEQRIVTAGGSAWGCDACQRICPYNLHAKKQPLPEFEASFQPCAISGADPAGRVYAWRGVEVIERNLRLLGRTNGNTFV